MSATLQYYSFQSFINGLSWEKVHIGSLDRHFIVLSEKVNLTILRATWRPGDERLFIICDGRVLLEEGDITCLDHFPGIDIVNKKLIHQNTNSGLLTLSKSAYNALIAPFDLNKELSLCEILLTSSARGNQSFAFGHFISEVLPEMLDIQNLANHPNYSSVRLLTYPLESWSTQLLDIFYINHELIEALPRIEVPPLAAPIYTTYKVDGRFYRCNNRDDNIYRMIPAPAKVPKCNKSLRSLVFLSRESAGPNRPKRWTDIINCYNLACGRSDLLQVYLDNAGSGGPAAFQSKYTTSKTNLFICSPGSAVYNVLYLTSSPALVAIESIPLHADWEGQIADLRPYGDRIVFISKKTTNDLVQWDRSFKIGELPSLQCLNIIFDFMVTVNFLSRSERFVITYEGFFLSLPLPTPASA